MYMKDAGMNIPPSPWLAGVWGGRVAFRSTAVQNGPWFDAIPLALAFLKMSNVINLVLRT